MNSCWPTATLAPEVLTCSAEGIAGPPASEAMYAATAWVATVLSAGGLRGFSAAVCFAGIRPVLTWKSTAAAPTPIRLGATGVPCASRPWQLEQFLAKISWPCAICCWSAGGADADAEPPAPVMAA